MGEGDVPVAHLRRAQPGAAWGAPRGPGHPPEVAGASRCGRHARGHRAGAADGAALARQQLRTGSWVPQAGRPSSPATARCSGPSARHGGAAAEPRTDRLRRPPLPRCTRLRGPGRGGRPIPRCLPRGRAPGRGRRVRAVGRDRAGGAGTSSPRSARGARPCGGRGRRHRGRGRVVASAPGRGPAEHPGGTRACRCAGAVRRPGWCATARTRPRGPPPRGAGTRSRPGPGAAHGRTSGCGARGAGFRPPAAWGGGPRGTRCGRMRPTLRSGMRSGIRARAEGAQRPWSVLPARTHGDGASHPSLSRWPG
jgi:hypothetical protein